MPFNLRSIQILVEPKIQLYSSLVLTKELVKGRFEDGAHRAESQFAGKALKERQL